MIIKILSDLHLEFSSGRVDIPAIPEDKNTILVLAGDIGIASKKGTYQEWIEDMSLRFKEIIFIMGNHEHYHGKFTKTKQLLIDTLSNCPNVHVLEKETNIFNGVAFICATLWTDMDRMNPLTMLDAKLGMNDYRLIRTGPVYEPWKRKLSPEDTVADHLNAVEYIFTEIKKQQELGNKVVVVTHHGMSKQSIVDQFKSENNGAYVSDLEHKILETQPDLVIHGHTHVSLDYMIGTTRVIVNPRGYHQVDQNPDFNPSLTVDI